MAKSSIGTVYLVGAGPGRAGLLTLRGAELLARADVIVHDAILNPALLEHARPGAQIIAAGRRGADRTRTQEDLNALLVENARSGKTVIRLKGGDPYVFGRGGEEAEELAAAGIPFEVVPGVSSFSAVPGAAGIPLTHRDYASAFLVVTGHEDPTKPGNSVDWGLVARSHGTKVILMGMERLEAILAALIAGGLSTATPAALVHWGTTARQRTIVGTLETLASKVREAGITAPGIVVVGEVVALHAKLNWFEKRPLFGRRVVVTRRKEQSGELVAALTEHGAEVLEIPTIRIGPPDERQAMIESLAGLGEYDWIVFSSANGVSAFFDALLAAYEDVRAIGNLRIATVGSATAARVRQWHLRVDAVPSEFTGRHIAEAIAEKESLENLRILVARAQAGSLDLCRELEERGAIVDDVAFYQTRPESSEPSAPGNDLKKWGADWITFTSGSTVEHFHARFDLPDLVARHPAMRLASIGPETTKALTALGMRPTVEATPHTAEGLVQAIVRAAPGPAMPRSEETEDDDPGS